LPTLLLPPGLPLESFLHFLLSRNHFFCGHCHQFVFDCDVFYVQKKEMINPLAIIAIVLALVALYLGYSFNRH